MIRVLHVCAVDAHFETRRSIDQLARGLGEGFAVAVRRIGRGGDHRHLPGAAWSLGGQAAGFDLVHTWDTTSLLAAAFSGHRRILHTPRPNPGRSDRRWLRSTMAYRDLHLICPTATLRRQCVEADLPPDRCHLIRPGVDFSRIRRRRDLDLRRRLSFADDDYVILLSGESTRAADHRLGIWTSAILNVVDPRYKALIWGRGHGTASAARFAGRVSQTPVLCVAEAQLGRPIDYDDLLPAADLVLVTAQGGVATLPVAMAMAAGMPIVATVSYTIGELLEDRHTALMVSEPGPRALARRVLDLRQDTSLQWSICDMARTEAYEYFSLTRFLSHYRIAYRQVAEGAPVDIPVPAPGAGLRFHGRG